MEKNLLKSVSEKTKRMVRFPNESVPIEIDFDINEFKPEKEFKDEVFGWYKNTYVSISK